MHYGPTLQQLGGCILILFGGRRFDSQCLSYKLNASLIVYLESLLRVIVLSSGLPKVLRLMIREESREIHMELILSVRK